MGNYELHEITNFTNLDELHEFWISQISTDLTDYFRRNIQLKYFSICSSVTFLMFLPAI